MRADPTKSVQEYKSEFRIGSGSPARRNSSSGRSGGPRKPAPRLQPTLSAYDAALLVGNALDRATSDGPAQLFPAGDLPFFEPGFDNLVIGRAGVTIVGSKAYSSAVQIEAPVSWSSTSIPANVLSHGRNLRDLVDLAVEQRTALEAVIAAAKFKFEVPAFSAADLVGLARELVLRVSALVLERAAFAEMDDAGDRLVEQLEVVAGGPTANDWSVHFRCLAARRRA